MGLETQLSLEVCLLQAGLDGVQEATSVRAINHAVIVSQGQVAHGTDSNAIVAIDVLDNHRALDDVTGTQNCHVGLVDNRGIEQSAEDKKTGHPFFRRMACFFILS